MVFSSPSFIFVFLPLFFASYYLIAPRARNALIFLGSVLFYFIGATHVAFLLVLTVPLNHYFGRYIHGNFGTRRASAAVLVGVLANLAPLLVYKYLGFFTQSLNDGFLLAGLGKPFAVPELLLPAGISFFTFQGLSYLIDIHRRVIDPAPTMIDFAMYHTSFPQLIAGPIVRYVEIQDRVRHRPIEPEQVEWGIVRFCVGLAKKIIIADNMGAVADRIFALPPDQLTGPLAWLGALTYSLQIYFDFSGYSDMAIGLGAMLGFRFPENFDQPYRSQSVTEFWRRWHMTLSRWFRDYVYIPLGGNRAGPLRTYCNLFVVFFLCGLWHGAAYTFIVWGLIHGMLLVGERVLRNRLGFVPSGIAGWLCAQLLVMMAWVFFRSDSVDAAVRHLSVMFGGGTASEQIYSVMFYMTWDKIFFLVIGLLVALLPAERFRGLLEFSPRRPALWMRTGALVGFVYALSLIAANGFNPFIYFRF